ncbi:DUF3336 domain-containing protein [Algiphilus sp.]|uniref:DUF3336 domain-containing protein n=1 Tax=Algiphilus sp. TaxID=1872431 RepID=UPI0025BBC077|nr:DUF3336 domain-containing protein [Algiphilus sp.]MCK5770567.1 DUF3336 domain-containing protein [Algiphilus sp.]
MADKRLKTRLRDLEHAQDYASWHEIAEELDRLEGLDAWRADDASDDYDYLLIKERLAEMRALRSAGEVRHLAFSLHEGLHGNIGNIANPALHGVARCGTKHLIEQYVNEVARCIDYISAGDFPDFPPAEKVLFFKRTGSVFGRSALMLSGGASLGMFHLGVVKALFENGLLPRVLSGSSAGSIIASMVCVRTDEQLPDIFARDGIHLDAFQRVSLRGVLRGGSVMEGDALQSCLQRNIGDATFEQAFESTRRMLGITVSPAEPNQHGRLLNYLTAPHVMINSATLASCAIPGVFPSVMLQARDFDGDVVPYMPSKRWVDGTLSADLPMLRLARLHNVNHYIVSQTNPHVVPFLRDRQRDDHGLLPWVRELAATSGRNALRVTRKHFAAGNAVLAQAYGVVRQRYSGDVTVFPKHSPRQLIRMLANPTADEIDAYIREGERATWPKLARIATQTRISRSLEDATARLKTHSPARGSRTRALRAVTGGSGRSR